MTCVMAATSPTTNRRRSNCSDRNPSTTTTAERREGMPCADEPDVAADTLLRSDNANAAPTDLHQQQNRQ